MRIGILVLSVGPFGNKGFYNLQEVGLAKALDRYCEEVKVYKAVPQKERGMIEPIAGTDHAVIQYIPCRKIGTNGMPDLKEMDATLDLLICFSDTQLMLPRVFRWSEKNGVRFLPYIGVMESHSTNKINAWVMDALFIRNVRIYRKCICLAKTPDIVKGLLKKGVKKVVLGTVGLDLSILRTDFEDYNVDDLKGKYGYKKDDKVLLFVGRMIDEKRPAEMIDIFSAVHRRDGRYRLLMVGDGELLGDVQKAVGDERIGHAVRIIGTIPNEDMWEVYRIADYLINLNKKEIFGMTIMEAMYYGCKVIAWRAPGPDWIIEDRSTGYLVSDRDELLERIAEGKDLTINARTRVREKLTWDHTAQAVMQIAL